MKKDEQNMEALVDEARALAGEKFSYEAEKHSHAPTKSYGLALVLLQMAGGLLASIAFLALAFALDIYAFKFLGLIVGAAFIIISLTHTRFIKRDIPETIGLFFFAVGFFLQTIGLIQLELGVNIIVLISVLVAMLSIRFSKGNMTPFLAVQFLALCLFAFVYENQWHNGIHFVLGFFILGATIFHFFEAKWITRFRKRPELVLTLGTASTLSSLVLLELFHIGSGMNFNANYLWLSSIAPYLMCLLLIFRKIKSKIVVAYAAITLLPLAILTPDIIGSMFFIMLGFAFDRKAVLILGTLAFSYYSFDFYYTFEYNLLAKSMMLSATGLMFLLAYFILSRIPKTPNV
jgi:hypothetical protein